MNEKKSLIEFLENKKKNGNKEKQIDWTKRKEDWKNSIEFLYSSLDNLIISNFKNAGYDVIPTYEELKITEDYLGSYYVQKYIIKADNIIITFNPIGSIIVGAYGRVDMLLPNETIKLIMPEWNVWKIVDGLGNTRKLLDLNEKNILKLFEENL